MMTMISAFFHSLAQSVAMGKYGFYVWPAYGLVVFIFLLHVWGVKWHHRQVRQTLQRWFK